MTLGIGFAAVAAALYLTLILVIVRQGDASRTNRAFVAYLAVMAVYEPEAFDRMNPPAPSRETETES